MSDLDKVKYHQKLLLHIAINNDSSKTLFFQNVITFDLSEEQVKYILKFIMKHRLEGLIDYLKNEKIDYPIINILDDCIKQDLCVENCQEMKLIYTTSS